jgi:hypothetical protein
MIIADRLVVRRVDRVAGGVVAVPGPVRAAADPDRIDAEEIGRRLDIRRIARGSLGRAHRAAGAPSCKQHEGPEHPPLRHRGRGLAGVVAALRAVLQRLAHVAELRAGEHVGALGHAGDAASSI